MEWYWELLYNGNANSGVTVKKVFTVSFILRFSSITKILSTLVHVKMFTFIVVNVKKEDNLLPFSRDLEVVLNYIKTREKIF